MTVQWEPVRTEHADETRALVREANDLLASALALLVSASLTPQPGFWQEITTKWMERYDAYCVRVGGTNGER